MISLLDVAERVRTGTKMVQKEYDLGLFRKTRELVQRYRLKNAGKDEFWDVDNAYVDDLFQAGIDFLQEWGAYDVTTQRVIKFTEDEIRLAAREAPTRVVVGTGKELRTIRRRGLEDQQPPFIYVSGHACWDDERVPIPLPIVVREMTRDPRVDAIQGFMYATIDGREVIGEPMWAYAEKRAIERVRSGLNMAGRAGLCLIQYPTQTRAFVLISALDPDRGLRRSDGSVLSIQPDLHIETNMIAASLVFEDYGLAYKENQGGGTSFAGDVYSAMIIDVASPLTAWMVYRDAVHASGRPPLPSGFQPWGRAREPPTLAEMNLAWLGFATRKALLRNTNIITKSWIWGGHSSVNEQMSEAYLLQVALSAIKATLLGDHLHFGGAANPPTFPRWAIDVSTAAQASRFTLTDYWDLRQHIARKLPPLKPVHQDRRMLVYSKDTAKHLLDPQLEVYDFIKQRIAREYLENEKKVKKYLADYGLQFQYI